MLADPWKVGATIGIAYVLVAGFTLNVRSAVPPREGFRTLTPPLGGWMLFPVAMSLFPVLACVSAGFSVYLLTRLLAGHSLTAQELTQLLVFFISVPMCTSCTISFFRWCVVRRRYNETGFEWGVIRFNRRIEWTDVASYRADEFRGLELRLRNGSKVKVTAYLNGVSEMAQTVGDWLAANPA